MRINFVSFQFYEHLIEIDLSSNIIEDIEDKSFAAQKYLIKLDLSHNKIQDIKPKVNRNSTLSAKIISNRQKIDTLWHLK